MRNSQSLYQLWSTSAYFDETTRAELAAAAADPREIEDRFYRDLEFGTGGLRGVIGAGTNRMNRYVVRQATQGLADYIRAAAPGAHPSVVIAHDSRRCSKEYALEAALTLGAAGIVAYLWADLRPTPMLSFAVRYLGATAGIVITASHNPKEYNGYKVYWSDGGQVPPERAGAIAAYIRAIADITAIRPITYAAAQAQDLVRPVPPWVDRAYYDAVAGLFTTDRVQRRACRLLYTPIHGTGNIPVRTVLSEAGFAVSVVAAQAEPDPEFATVRSPNPEDPAVFALALRQAETEQPDVILATDPDGDRLGVMVRDRQGGYLLLNGNQTGAVLVDYLLASRRANGTLPANGAVIKTIATSNMIAPLCRDYGVALLDTHTGFKFIGDKVREFAETGRHTFLFGYEESYGYLGADFVRDKDAVMAAAMVADAAAFHKAQGRTLYDALTAIWARCGCFLEDLYTVTLPGQDGQAQIARLMAQLRREPPVAFAGCAVAYSDDYAAGAGVEPATGRRYALELDRADVLHYRFADGGFVMVRPSGTEPKLKLYFSVRAGDPAAAQERLAAVRADLLARLQLT